MEPVPYEVRDEDIQEVLTACQVPEDRRAEARDHVIRYVTDVDDIVKSAPEIELERVRTEDWVDRSDSNHPGDQSFARRELALAAIEDILIRDGYVDVAVNEKRVYPATTVRDTERDDG